MSERKVKGSNFVAIIHINNIVEFVFIYDPRLDLFDKWKEKHKEIDHMVINNVYKNDEHEWLLCIATIPKKYFDGMIDILDNTHIAYSIEYGNDYNEFKNYFHAFIMGYEINKEEENNE